MQGVREESPPDQADEKRERIFLPHPLAERTSQWEGGEDPMTQFSFTDDYDDHGQPRRQTRIACPRGWRTLVDTPRKPYLATRTMTSYASPSSTGPYIIDRVASMTNYEIRNGGDETVLDLKKLPDDSPLFQINGQTLHFYDGQAFQGLSSGKIGRYGALVRSEALVLTQDILHEAYKSGSTILMPPEEPPYFALEVPPIWTTEYPQKFRDSLPGLAGYSFMSGDGVHARGYFASNDVTIFTTTRRAPAVAW
jgi:hypothetical protein